MIAIANAFPKLKNVKAFVRPLSKKRSLRTRFESQDLRAFQALGKSPWERFYHIFWSFSKKLIWIMSSIVWGEISAVFVNTLSTDGMFPVQDCENLELPIQMELSQKRKTFSGCFVPFLESTSNFKHFEKKDDCQS